MGKRITKQRKFQGQKKNNNGPLGLQSRCHVYNITVGNKVYVGFTSRPVHLRVEEHIENAKEGSRTFLFQQALKENNCEIDGIWWETYPNEYLALRREQQRVKELGGPKSDKCLNSTIGGEGTNIILNRKGIPKPRKQIRRKKHGG